jgi:hypothetical protein
MASPEPPPGGNNDPANPSGQQLPAWSPQQELYDKHAGQAWTDQQASSDEFDKSLMTFSSGALGLSLSFIKDIVPLDKAGFLCWLFISWVSFSLCIVATMASFPFSIQAQKTHLDYLYKYYIEGRPEFFNKQSGWSIAVTVCAVLGAIFFFIGLAATVVFATANLSKGVHK